MISTERGFGSRSSRIASELATKPRKNILLLSDDVQKPEISESYSTQTVCSYAAETPFTTHRTMSVFVSANYGLLIQVLKA